MNLATLILALIAVETGGHKSPATAIGDGGRAVGILQIHRGVVADVRDKCGLDVTWPESCRDPETSRAICSAYLTYWGARYTRETGKPATAEVLAKIWNAGPNGWRKKNAERYWDKVRRTNTGAPPPADSQVAIGFGHGARR